MENKMSGQESGNKTKALDAVWNVINPKKPLKNIYCLYLIFLIIKSFVPVSAWSVNTV